MAVEKVLRRLTAHSSCNGKTSAENYRYFLGGGRMKN